MYANDYVCRGRSIIPADRLPLSQNRERIPPALQTQYRQVGGSSLHPGAFKVFHYRTESNWDATSSTNQLVEYGRPMQEIEEGDANRLHNHGEMRIASSAKNSRVLRFYRSASAQNRRPRQQNMCLPLRIRNKRLAHFAGSCQSPALRNGKRSLIFGARPQRCWRSRASWVTERAACLHSCHLWPVCCFVACSIGAKERPQQSNVGGPAANVWCFYRMDRGFHIRCNPSDHRDHFGRRASPVPSAVLRRRDQIRSIKH